MKNTTQTEKASAARIAHTPGEWRVEGSFCDGSNLLILDDSKEQNVIADCCHANGIEDGFEAQANAALIAAAPDLLEACKLALPHHQGFHSPVGNALRAAIAKAEGRQP